MSIEYDGGDSFDSGEVTSVDSSVESDSGEESSAFESSVEDSTDTAEDVVPEASAEKKNVVSSTTKESGDEVTAFAENPSKDKECSEDKTESNKYTAFEGKNTVDEKENDYSRPTHWRAGMRDEVWDGAKDDHGRVRDSVSGKYMCKDQPWDMGHKPGYEFYKHQQSARERGISRKEFLDEYYNSDHYRPELPSSNRSHKGENVTDDYFGN